MVDVSIFSEREEKVKLNGHVITVGSVNKTISYDEGVKMIRKIFNVE